MARAFTVPLYTTATQLNGATKRKLSTVSPGSTDSTASKGPSATVLAGQNYYVSPEATATAGTLQPVGTASGIGHGFVPSDTGGIVPFATDGFALAAGTIRTAITVTRDNGLTSADQTMSFTVIFFRANANATLFPQELGRATLSSQVVTTSKFDYIVDVPTAAATFAPGEILWREIFVTSTTTSVTGSVASFYTNSNTSTRITQMPAFTINYSKALADTPSISDLLSRRTVNTRRLSDLMSLVDGLQRIASFPRALNDSQAVTGDLLSRLYVANRQLADTSPTSEAIVRRITTMRRLADAMSLFDDITRRATYARAPSDFLSTGGGNTTIIRRTTHVFDD